MFREEKLVAVAEWYYDKLANTTSTLLDITKFTYTVERESLIERVSQLVGDSFWNMKFGPVPSKTYNLAKEYSHGALWSRFFRLEDQNTVALIERPGYRHLLSPSDLEVLDRSWKIVGRLPTSMKVQYIHENFPEWEDPKPKPRSELSLERIIEHALKVSPERASSQARMIRNAESLMTWFEDAKRA
jgi:uncharacterized phage-associated protein